MSILTGVHFAVPPIGRGLMFLCIYVAVLLQVSAVQFICIACHEWPGYMRYITKALQES